MEPTKASREERGVQLLKQLELTYQNGDSMDNVTDALTDLAHAGVTAESLARSLRSAMIHFQEEDGTELVECALCDKLVPFKETYSPADEAICAECNEEVAAATPPSIFNTSTVELDQRDGKPCLNVKVRHGFDSITQEQWAEIRAVAYDQDATLTFDALQKLNADWCEEFIATGENYHVWHDACAMNFEQAEQDALALFGKGVKCALDGRSGGWLVVEGLPDVGEWDDLSAGDDCRSCGTKIIDLDVRKGECIDCGEPVKAQHDLPNLRDSAVGGAQFKDGTPLSDTANIWERWAFFTEACAGYVADVPRTCADILAANIFPAEYGTRPVEFLRAWPDKTWDTYTVDVPNKVKDHDALAAFYLAFFETEVKASGIIVSVYKDN